MDAKLNNGRAETLIHARLKRLALLWAQAQGYSACALEVSLPHCRYRADVAAYRPKPSGVGLTAIFECKQALPDLRRDNCCSVAVRARLETVYRRRQILERNLRVHYPNLRIADSLFPEFDSYDFAAIEHHGYARVLRELSALQNCLFDCTKFEKLLRYRCANLFFLVLPNELFEEIEIPVGWGALVESDGAISLARKPVRHENAPENRLRFLQRIAAAGTRVLNRQLEITFDDVVTVRGRCC
ncbi:MAG: hypothetical protein DMF47_00075 [Verrucomicrobia bacterium]|nr:MAG: hypothetical protein DMF47_00075 [Verrucomicrobiota bacterium]PYL85692.1 MAG: hypothetical protein DMF17_07650 [Verrucomicrobiota bacterium]